MPHVTYFTAKLAQKMPHYTLRVRPFMKAATVISICFAHLADELIKQTSHELNAHSQCASMRWMMMR